MSAAVGDTLITGDLCWTIAIAFEGESYAVNPVKGDKKGLRII